MIVVGDASVLIALSRIGRLELLRQLYGEVIVPNAVWHEVFGAGRIAPPAWIVRSSEIGMWNGPPFPRLGAGEREAIALARALTAELLLMDERRGRNFAVSLGLNVAGLIAVLLAAKRESVIPEVAAVLAELRQQDFWLSDALVARALEIAGETPKP